MAEELKAEHAPGLEIALKAMLKHRVAKGGVHLDALALLEGMIEEARAQLPSQGGEAVEVVCITQGGCNVTWTATKELTPAGTALMSVRQHQRILAADTHPADQAEDDLTMVKVSRELLGRIIKRGMRLPDETQHQHLEELRALLASAVGYQHS